jgi:Flp pilus assembly protein TadD
MRYLTLLLCGLLLNPVLAAACPPAPDHGVALGRLLDDLREAGSEAAARDVSDQMWALWTEAPDARAQALLDRGMQLRVSGDLAAAIDPLDRLVAYCPDYAEGYNQRAFVHFLAHDFSAALPDLDRALALSPTHVGALSGKALTLMALGRTDEARQVLGAALALNPWLAERRLLAKGGALAPPGEDI